MIDLDRLTWRSVLADHQPHAARYRYAAWVRDLSDRAGVYLVRADLDRFDDEILYIGESHTHTSPDRRRTFRGLYRTVTRHFHPAHDWAQGVAYDPHDVLVAVIPTEPDRAVDLQYDLIAAWQPRDNELGLQLRFGDEYEHWRNAADQ